MSYLVFHFSCEGIGKGCQLRCVCLNNFVPLSKNNILYLVPHSRQRYTYHWNNTQYRGHARAECSPHSCYVQHCCIPENMKYKNEPCYMHKMYAKKTCHQCIKGCMFRSWNFRNRIDLVMTVTLYITHMNWTKAI